MARELLLALRWLRGHPVSGAIVIASLALGIGANAALFTWMDALLWRPLPGLAEPDRLVVIYGNRREEPANLGPVSYANFLDYQAAAPSLVGLEAFTTTALTLTEGGSSERLEAVAVSPGYFSLLGVRPTLGSFETLEDENAGPMAVLAHGLWQRRFHSDPDVLGRKVLLNGQPVTVAAVAQPDFAGTDRVHSPQIWVPLTTYREVAVGIFSQLGTATDRGQPWLYLLGRLAPGEKIARAAEGLSLVARRLEELYPDDNSGEGVATLPLTQLAFGPGMRERVVRYSAILMTAVALVLLAACGNVAGLLVARGLAREEELATRRALGATSARLARLVLAESLVLGLLGGVAALAVAVPILPLLEYLQLPAGSLGPLGFPPRVFGFTLVAGLVSGLLFGLTTALRTIRISPAAILKGIAPPRRRRLKWLGLRDVLAVVQIALALLVLAAAALLLRSLGNLRAIDPGFDPDHVFVASLDLDAAGYSKSAVSPFYEGLTERLRRLPDVENVSLAAAVPMVGAPLEVRLTVDAEDAGTALPGGAVHALVGRGFFSALGIPILEGRDFDARDTPTSQGVVIVNNTLARQLWPSRQALGRRLRLLQTPEPFEVVGVVADSKVRSLREPPAPTLYLYHGQHEKSFIGSMLAPAMTLILRSGNRAAALGEPVRRTVQAIDPLLPLLDARPLAEVFSSAVRAERQLAIIFGAFALLAVGLAMLGLGGVVAHSVAERRREIGIRLALGASPATVRRLVLRRALMLSSLGCVLGLAAAAALGRFLASQLYDVTALDPATWLGAALILLTLSLLVSDGPARRAARTAPRESLLT
jgi:predicted permease